MTRANLIGLWGMVSAEFRLANGEIADLYGPAPTGRILYTAGGDMAVQIMRADRPLFAAADLSGATGPEAQAAISGYMAYFGDYTVDEAESSVTHHLKGSVYPNWIGTDLKRSYEISGNRLTLHTAPLVSNGQSAVGVLVWERR